MTEVVSPPANGVYAAISVAGLRFEWEISWVTVLGFVFTVIVVYGHLCFLAGKKMQEWKTPYKIQKAVPEEIWVAKTSGEKYHIYGDCGYLKSSNSKLFNSFCAQCASLSRLRTFKPT